MPRTTHDQIMKSIRAKSKHEVHVYSVRDDITVGTLNSLKGKVNSLPVYGFPAGTLRLRGYDSRNIEGRPVLFLLMIFSHFGWEDEQLESADFSIFGDDPTDGSNYGPDQRNPDTALCMAADPFRSSTAL